MTFSGALRARGASGQSKFENFLVPSVSGVDLHDSAIGTRKRQNEVSARNICARNTCARARASNAIVTCMQRRRAHACAHGAHVCIAVKVKMDAGYM